LTLIVKNSNCKLIHNIISKNLFNIQIVGREIGSFGVCFCVGFCGGANPKCANVGWLKLFFKMCGGKIFKTNALA
jgi:hypothetical protein